MQRCFDTSRKPQQLFVLAQPCGDLEAVGEIALSLARGERDCGEAGIGPECVQGPVSGAGKAGWRCAGGGGRQPGINPLVLHERDHLRLPLGCQRPHVFQLGIGNAPPLFHGLQELRVDLPPHLEGNAARFLRPFDQTAAPSFSFSTGNSWQAVATHYASLVDRAIADAGTAGALAGAPQLEFIRILAKGETFENRIGMMLGQPGKTVEQLNIKFAAHNQIEQDAVMRSSLAQDLMRLQLEKGKINALQGRNDEALAIFSKILAENPTSSDARLEMGRVYDMSGDPLKALTSFSEVIERTLDSFLCDRSLKIYIENVLARAPD